MVAFGALHEADLTLNVAAKYGANRAGPAAKLGQ